MLEAKARRGVDTSERRIAQARILERAHEPLPGVEVHEAHAVSAGLCIRVGGRRQVGALRRRADEPVDVEAPRADRQGEVLPAGPRRVAQPELQVVIAPATIGNEGGHAIVELPARDARSGLVRSRPEADGLDHAMKAVPPLAVDEAHAHEQADGQELVRVPVRIRLVRLVRLVSVTDTLPIREHAQHVPIEDHAQRSRCRPERGGDHDPLPMPVHDHAAIRLDGERELHASARVGRTQDGAPSRSTRGGTPHLERKRSVGKPKVEVGWRERDLLSVEAEHISSFDGEPTAMHGCTGGTDDIGERLLQPVIDDVDLLVEVGVHRDAPLLEAHPLPALEGIEGVSRDVITHRNLPERPPPTQ